MKRCCENPFTTIPSDAFDYLHQYLSPGARKALSQVDKYRLEVCSKLANSICFFPSEKHSDAPENIYPCLIERYPNIQKLTLESRYLSGNEGASHEKQIQTLIAFLTTNLDKHPLSHIRNLDIQEIKWADNLKHANELNRSFLGALSHAKLESVTWRILGEATLLKGEEIQPILEKATELKHFQLNGHILSDQFNLSFEKQPHLVSAIFNPGLFIYHKTITSLSGCRDLKTLAVGCHFLDMPDMQKAFNKNSWNLKRLTLLIPSKNSNITFTKQMPELEFLTILDGLPSDRLRLGKLGLNCPKLKELRILKLGLNEDRVDRQLQGLSNLELLIFKGSDQLAERVWDSIKANCPKIDSKTSTPISLGCTEWTFYSSLNNTLNLSKS